MAAESSLSLEKQNRLDIAMIFSIENMQIQSGLFRCKVGVFLIFPTTAFKPSDIFKQRSKLTKVADNDKE